MSDNTKSKRHFNIFEGCRRIIRLIAIIVVVVGVWHVVFPSPYVHATIAFRGTQGPTLVAECPHGSNVAREYVPSYKSPIRDTSLTVCFIDVLTASADSVRRLEASVDPRIADRFGQEIGRIATERRAEYRIDAVKNTAVALAVIFLLAYLIGWIVRGFAGIARGQDFRN